MKAERIQFEHLDAPIGLTVPCPFVTRTCAGWIFQTAYEILAETRSGKHYESGKTETSEMSHRFLYRFPRGNGFG